MKEIKNLSIKPFYEQLSHGLDSGLFHRILFVKSNKIPEATQNTELTKKIQRRLSPKQPIKRPHLRRAPRKSIPTKCRNKTIANLKTNDYDEKIATASVTEEIRYLNTKTATGFNLITDMILKELQRQV